MILFCKYALFSAIYSFVNAFTHFNHYKMIMKEILNVLSKNITAKSMVIFFLHICMYYTLYRTFILYPYILYLYIGVILITSFNEILYEA